jgi:hypothetical protein
MFGQEYYGKYPHAQPGHRFTSYDALDIAAEKVVDFALQQKPTPVINYPELGCGLGSGDWAIVSAILNTRFSIMDHVHWKYSR